jgi:tetratricopeptide (TPR) repeat protein
VIALRNALLTGGLLAAFSLPATHTLTAQPGRSDELEALAARLETEPASAIQPVRDALARRLAGGDSVGAGLTRILLIDGLTRTGQLNEALALLPDAQDATRTLPLRIARRGDLVIARLCRAAGFPVEADRLCPLETAGEAADHREAETTAAARCREQEAIAREHRAAGRLTQAVAHLRQARLELGRAALPDPDEPRLILALGWLLLEQGDRDGAEQCFREVLALIGTGRRLDLLWLGLFGLGRVAEQAQEDKRALALYRDATSALVLSETAGRGEVEVVPISPPDLFAAAIRLHARIGGSRESADAPLGFAERFAEHHRLAVRFARPPAARSAPQVLAASLDLRWLVPLESEERDALRRERVAAGLPPEPDAASTRAIEGIRTALRSEREAALLYRAGHDALLGLAVTRRRAELIVLEGPPAEWEQRVARFRLLLGEFGFGRDAVPGARDLYRGLVAPLLEAAECRDADRWLVVPDGPLARLPFSALAPPDDPQRTWLGFLRRISYFPDVESLRAAADLMAPAEWARVLAFADLNDVGAAKHASWIARHGRLGRAAVTETPLAPTALADAVAEFAPDIIHLDAAPDALMAALRGGRDKPTHAGLATRIELDGASLLFARAGREVGAGLAEIAGPWLRLGAGSVLALRWPIEPRVARRFLERFFHHLADGLDLGTALLETRRDFSRSPGFGGPSTWAAFDLVGDDRRTYQLDEPFRWFTFWWVLALVATLVAGFRIVRVMARASAAS